MPTRKFSNWSDRVMPIGSTGVLGGKNQSNNIVMPQVLGGDSRQRSLLNHSDELCESVFGEH
jgi:hypothetical protein